MSGSHLLSGFRWLSQEPLWIICVHLPLSPFDGHVFIFLFSSLSGEKGKMPGATAFQVIRKAVREGLNLGVMFFSGIREGGHGLSYSSSSKNSSHGGRSTKFKDWEKSKEKIK